MPHQPYIHKYPWGSMVYYKDQEHTIIHRVDGPAIIWKGGHNEYYINNVCYSKEKFDILSKKFKEEDIEDAVDLLSI